MSASDEVLDALHFHRYSGRSRSGVSLALEEELEDGRPRCQVEVAESGLRTITRWHQCFNAAKGELRVGGGSFGKEPVVVPACGTHIASVRRRHAERERRAREAKARDRQFRESKQQVERLRERGITAYTTSRSGMVLVNADELLALLDEVGAG